MNITGEQIKKLVSENKHRHFSLDSRLSMEYLIWFTHDVLREIGEKETAEKVKELIYAIDGLETSELANLHIW